MTTANGYLRLALFKFPQSHRSSMLFDAEKRNRHEKIVNFVARVYAPMFLRVHLKPRASDGPGNVIFLRDLLLSFKQQDQTLVCEAIKKCFLTHATAWLNPTNVALSVFSDNPPFPLSAVLSTEQSLPSQVNTHEMLWSRSPLRSFFSEKSKSAPCLQCCHARFWRSIDNHNRTCERYIGKLSTALEGKKVRNNTGTISKIQADNRITGYVVNE